MYFFGKENELGQLADLMAEKGIGVLELTDGELKIRIDRTVPAASESGAPKRKEENAKKIEKAEGKAVKSPMVGVFYSSPSPDSKPFVSVGDRVRRGDVLCIVEAMKLMNEITADEDGEIAEICVEDGAVVEYGQCLFYIK